MWSLNWTLPSEYPTWLPSNVTSELLALYRVTYEDLAAVHLALKEIDNRGDILPDYELKVVISNDDYSAAKVSLLAPALLTNDATPFPEMIIGFYGREAAKWGSIVAASFDMPVLSTFVSDTNLIKEQTGTDLTTFTFSRLGFDTKSVSECVVRLCDSMNWRRVAAVFDCEVSSTIALVQLQQEAQAFGLDLKIVSIRTCFPFTGERREAETRAKFFDEATRELASLRDLGYRIISLFALMINTNAIFQVARDLNMVNERFVWIGTPSWSFTQEYYDANVLPTTYLSVFWRFDDTLPEYLQFEQSWAREYARDPDFLFRVQQPFLGRMRYDAMFLTAHALHRIYLCG